MDSIKNKKVAVIGLGLEGKDAVNFLLLSGAEVTVFDYKTSDKLDYSGISKEKVKFVTGENYLDAGFSGFDIIVRSPGVYRYSKELIEAEKNGITVTSPIKLFFDLCPATIIGITGTKGKGTTSTLISEILKTAGKTVYLAGNIGNAILSKINSLKSEDWVVLELSSFQLIDLHKSPHIAVVLNITQDHLDWHKNIEEYIAAKRNIVLHQTPDNFAVINADYQVPYSFSNLTPAHKYYFSKNKKVAGVYVENGVIKLHINDSDLNIGRTNKLLLRGEHNWENINAAIGAAYLAGADISSIKKTVFAFKGLEHRLELVRDHENIKYYNDSFSTNPQTTIAAIKSFSEPLTLILGGSSKGLDYHEMAQEIMKNDNVKSIILIGDIAQLIATAFKDIKYKRNIINMGKPTMTDIIKQAREITPENGVVLLSPATASFDMFENYKARGNQFKNAVNAL
jgi:UDP-N-acetylmuramoylalanine--D-glutamate ligase